MIEDKMVYKKCIYLGLLMFAEPLVMVMELIGDGMKLYVMAAIWLAARNF